MFIILLFIKKSNCNIILLYIIPINYLYTSFKVINICVAMVSFINMRFWFDILPDCKDRIMIGLCKQCYNNLECLCKCYLEE